MTRVFAVDRPNYANFTVQVVTSPAAADLCVYQDDQATSPSHGEGIWTFTKGRENAQAAIYITPPGRGGAHLKVCWVRNPSLSGWMRGHRLKGRLKGVTAVPMA